MLRDKMIDCWVEELDKEIIDLQALREEVTGEQANEAVRTLTDPDYRAEVGNIGDGIRSRRNRAKMTQEELAEKIDIAVNNMGKIERGESFVTAVTLEKLASVLNVKVEDFFKFDSFVSIEEMKSELDFEKMSDDEITQLYRFYKLFLC